ncbi:MAG: serine/threonine protein kinase [Gammaproteobacteria bacterium]|nr:serine/threonine protein kinase [Gammaproteobacteria bacterium]
MKQDLDKTTHKIKTPSSSSSVPDIQISGYKIMRELGHGGMAHVYLAVQESFGRKVALKILSPHLTDDEQFSKRFLREASIVSQLNHPNIVTVFDAGKQGKYHYMSMEYIPGKDLKQLKDSISREEAIRIIKDVARALDFAGSKGIVHRDVKPENIMIHQTDNRVILMDFGIAHGSDVSQGMTQTGSAIGTPHFMSPEQTKGLKVDHRSDIYSLGVVLYQLLAGNLPFDADSAVAVGIKHLTAPIPLLPGGLEIFQPIINHCLSKDPKHRYQKASEIVTALNKISKEQLENIKTKATGFKKAGSNHNAKTQVGDVVISQNRKVPDLVFPSINKTAVNERVADNKNSNTRRRNLLILLLLASASWGAIEKQKELTHFWGYKALPEIVNAFPDLFPKSYTQYWTDKIKEEASIAVMATPSTTPIKEGNQASLEGKSDPLTLTGSETQTPKTSVQIKEDKIALLKEGLDSSPENAVELASIYKDMLLTSKQDPVARKGLNELQEWYIKQIALAFATEDAVLARQHIDIMKQNFPQVTKNKRFIRLEEKVALLERINVHLDKAEKHFNAGALSKPINKNALNEINKVLALSPKNEDAKNFMNKIIASYLDKTTKLEEQGNIHNAILMVEEGIAALNNNSTLVNKRKQLKDKIKHNKNIASLFKQAKKYQAANQLIKPIAYNAYDVYQEILKKEKDNLQAKAELRSIHQQLAKNITLSIQKGKLESVKNYLQGAIKRYGKSSLLASVQLKLNDALEKTAPKIEMIKLSASPVTKVFGGSSNDVLNNTKALKLKHTLYVGINYMNFDPATTWLEASVFDSTKKIKIAQKPVVISSQFGEHFFEINVPARGFTNRSYKIELKLKNKIMISKSFLVLN